MILTVKFSSHPNQEILLKACNLNLVYNDKMDDFLGMGPENKGQNFVGKYLKILALFGSST